MNYHKELEAEARKIITRRYFFKECGLGLGAMGLANLLSGNKAFGALIELLTNETDHIP